MNQIIMGISVQERFMKKKKKKQMSSQEMENAGWQKMDSKEYVVGKGG